MSDSKRDVRAADMLALILSGHGTVLTLVAFASAAPCLEFAATGAVFLGLGFLLNHKVRELYTGVCAPITTR